MLSSRVRREGPLSRSGRRPRRERSRSSKPTRKSRSRTPASSTPARRRPKSPSSCPKRWPGRSLCNFRRRAARPFPGRITSRTTGTVFFPANTTSQTINIPILGDQDQTQTESFNVVLSGQSLGTIARSTATVTLFNVQPGSLPPDEFDTASGETNFTADTSASGPVRSRRSFGASAPLTWSSSTATLSGVQQIDRHAAAIEHAQPVLDERRHHAPLRRLRRPAARRLRSATGRWYASALDQSVPPGSVGPAVNTDNILLAVSKTSDPTQGWVGFKVASDSTGHQPGRFRFARFQRLVGRRHGQPVQHCTGTSPVTRSFRCPRPT